GSKGKMARADMMGRMETAGDKKKKIGWAHWVPAVGAAFLFAASGCSESDGPEPSIEYATDVRIGGPDVNLKRDPREGVYLVEVREQDVDVTMRVASGTTQTFVADDVRRHGLHVAVVRLMSPAAIGIRLASADHPTKKGSAQIKLLRLSY